MPIFTHRSIIPTTLDLMMAFHAHPRALARLMPPFPIVQMHRDTRTSLKDGELDFTLWFPIPVRWTARHEPGPIETSFADRQISGPLKSWRHEHIFQPVAGGVELTDRVTYEHRSLGLWGIFTRLVFNPLMLRFLFIYRHWRTRVGVRKFTDEAAPVS